MKKKITIGLFGYGVVGQGVYNLFTNSKSLAIDIVKICAKHPEKRRNISMDHFTFDRNDILNDDAIDLIVEAIDDADAAFEILKIAFKSGKDVVTANKKMLAIHLEEIIALQEEFGRSVLYEGSSCGSIPIIRNLEEYYDNEMLNNVSGIFNSSSNYILSQIFNNNKDYDLAVKRAQDLGYLESDPSSDIIGYDALYKLLIVTAHAYGVIVKPEEVVLHGLQNLDRFDIEFAKEKGWVIKTIATVKKVDEENVCLYVLPVFVNEKSPYRNINNEDNAVMVEAGFSQNHFFSGKGAGGFPIGSAILSDVSAYTYNYKYAYKKSKQIPKLGLSTDIELNVYLRYFDEKNLELFQFEKIQGHYKSGDYNYVIGKIKLSSLLEQKDRLNTADIFMCLLPG
jgi:homoserine dehydrogenase